jgi:hypothetical protein
MSKAPLNCDSFPFLNKKRLMNLKTKAMHSGAWFKALRRIDRTLFDLTIRVVDKIRSNQLAKSMLMLSRKLENAMKNSFSIRLRTIGLPLAQKISLTAQKLGNKPARSWAFDYSFITFLAVLKINNVKVLRL